MKEVRCEYCGEELQNPVARRHAEAGAAVCHMSCLMEACKHLREGE